MHRLAVVVFLIPAIAGAAPFTVTSTADSGAGTLRAAIAASNAAPGANTISFALTGGTAPYTITLASPLPAISNTVTIDGTTQLGHTTAPIIVVDGAKSIGVGLQFITGSDGSTVRGLVVDNMNLAAIEIGVSSCTIAGNYLGTDATGLVVARNPVGVLVRQFSAATVSNLIIGGATAADRNVIGGNTTYGVDIEDGTQNITIEGNYFGIGADGVTPVANTAYAVYLNGGTGMHVVNNTIAESQDGVLVTTATGVTITGNVIGADVNGMPLPVDIGVDLRTTGNTIGGANPAAGNAIGDADLFGIALETGGNVVQGNTVVGDHTAIEISSSGNTIRGNVIASNTIGIDAVGGLQANQFFDNSIHDNGDSGIEGGVYGDRAVLSSAVIGASALTVTGALTSVASTSYTVQFFDNPTCDPSGAGEGETLLGETTVMTDATMMGTVTATLAATVAEGDAITATVTNQTQLSTSGFSTCVKACPAIAVAPSSLAITVGTPLAQSVTASGGIANYTYMVTAGALPAGVMLAADGSLSGTPTSDASASFTITATDAKGCSGTAMYTVQPGCPAITIAPPSLPDATAGQPYSQPLTATGGGGSDTFTATGLPAGIALAADGLLTGTVATAGSDPFTVTATEPSGCAAMASYTLVVACTVCGDDAGVDGAPGADAGNDAGASDNGGGGGGCCSTGGGLPGGSLVVAGMCLGIVTRRRRRSL